MTATRRSPKQKFDVEEVRRACEGRIGDVLINVAGIPAEIVDEPEREHPCPRCGGETRCRLIDEEAGAVRCSHCHAEKCGDLFSTIRWLREVSFPEAVALVAEHIGVAPKSGGKRKRKSHKGEADPAAALKFVTWSSELVQFLLRAKPGITEQSLLENGARMARYQGQTVIALPIIGQELDADKPVGWVAYSFDARPLPVFSKNGQVSATKVKTVAGSQAGLIGLRAAEALKAGREIAVCWKVEGVSDLLSLDAAVPDELRGSHFVVTNSGGCGEKPNWIAELLAKAAARINVIGDADVPGQEGAARWSQAIASHAGSGAEVRHVELPYTIEEHHGADLRDAIHDGTSYQDILALAEQTDPLVAKPSLPTLRLPGPDQTIDRAAAEAAALLAPQRTHFVRGQAVVWVHPTRDGFPVLSTLRACQLPSDLERVALLEKSKHSSDGDVITVPAICSESTAKLLIAARSFGEGLPAIQVLSACPLLVERGGDLVEVVGYDEGSGVLTHGAKPEPVTLDEARRLLHEILSGFRFATPADKSRALAAMITPALVLGGLLDGRAPVDLGEGDHSQAGKGYRNKLKAAIYAQLPHAVSQQRQGVGSLEESFDKALIAGQTFISIDNVRGKVDSPKIEQFLTEDTYSARIPFSPQVAIDPRRVCVMFTSNKADMTIDMANRSSCVRILKQPDGYEFPRYGKLDALAHVQANQPRYLGAVFAVVRAWHAAGKPRTKETRHDFRAWAQTLDWIVQNLLGAAPLMDGHRETQRRMTTPALNWLRDVAIAAVRAGRTDDWLIAADLLEVIEADGSVEIPGLGDGDPEAEATRAGVLRQIGRRLKRCFRDADRVTLDRLVIDRELTTDAESRPRHYYRISPQPDDPRDEPRDAPSSRGLDARGGCGSVNGHSQDARQTEKNPLSRDEPRDDPAMNPAIFPEVPAIPATVSNSAYAHTCARAQERLPHYGRIAGSRGIAGDPPANGHREGASI